jgi:peroxiredoxin-like protein
VEDSVAEMTVALPSVKRPAVQPLPHHYHVRLTGTPHGHARLSSPRLPDLPTASPPEFGGPGGAWSPEHLLLAAVESCYLFTLRAVARASGLEFTSLDLASDGIVDREDGVTRFTEIVLRPRLTVGPGVDLDRARRVLDKSERACLVSASLKTPVRVEPDLTVDSLPA